MNEGNDIACPSCGSTAEYEGIVLIEVEPRQTGDLFAYHKYFCSRCERRIFVEQDGYRTP